MEEIRCYFTTLIYHALFTSFYIISSSFIFQMICIKRIKIKYDLSEIELFKSVRVIIAR